MNNENENATENEITYDFIKGTQEQKDNAIALFKKNMAWITENPYLHAPLAGLKAIHKEKMPTLIFDENGHGNLEMDGSFLYDDNKKGSEEYYEDLKDLDMGIMNFPYSHYYYHGIVINKEQTESNIDLAAPIHCHRLRSELLREFTNKDLTNFQFDLNKQYENSYYGVIASISLGYHFKEFMKRRNPKTVAIFDSNIIYLFLSLHCVDYTEIFGHISHHNFNIVISSNVSSLDMAFCYLSTSYSPLALYRASYSLFQPDNVITKFFDVITQTRKAIMIQGFFQDEVGMQFNAIFNFKHGANLLTQGHPIINDLPVFIIGSGPSLTNDIEVIKQNKDKALLVACGSSLQAFKVNDLKPDIYVWLEKDTIWYERFRNNSYDLEDTLFLHPITTPPYEGVGRISSPYYINNTRLPRTVYSGKFKNHLAFVRSTVQAIWDPQHRFTMASEAPTVTNTAYGFMNKIGFTDTYLFGTDLGKKTEQHHCDYIIDTMTKADKEAYREQNVQEVQANFGGVATTMFPYDLSLGVFKTVTDHFKHTKPYLKLYNCSDGAFISGATPLISSEINLPELKRSKKEILEEIVDSYYKSSPASALGHWKTLYNDEQFNQYKEKVIAFFENEDLDWHAHSLYEGFRDVLITHSILLKKLFSGTLGHLVLMAQDAYFKVKEEHQEETSTFIRETVLHEVRVLFDQADLILKSYNAYMLYNSEVNKEDYKQILMYRNDVSGFNFDKSGLDNPPYSENNKLFTHEALLDELMIEINTKIAPKLISSSYKEYTGVGTALSILKNPFRLEYVGIDGKAKLLSALNQWVESTGDKELITKVKEIQAQVKLPTKPLYGDILFAHKTFDYLIANDLDEDFNRHLYTKMKLSLDYDRHLELKNSDILYDTSTYKDRKEFVQHIANRLKDKSNLYDDIDYYYRHEILSYNMEQYRQPIEPEHYLYDQLAQKLTPVLIDYMLQDKKENPQDNNEINLLDEYYNILADHMQDESISIYDRGILLAMDFLLCPVIEEKVLDKDLHEDTLNEDYQTALDLTNEVLEIPVILNRRLNVHRSFDVHTQIDFATVKDKVLKTIKAHKTLMKNWKTAEEQANKLKQKLKEQEET